MPSTGGRAARRASTVPRRPRAAARARHRSARRHPRWPSTARIRGQDTGSHAHVTGGGVARWARQTASAFTDARTLPPPSSWAPGTVRVGDHRARASGAPGQMGRRPRRQVPLREPGPSASPAWTVGSGVTSSRSARGFRSGSETGATAGFGTCSRRVGAGRSAWMGPSRLSTAGFAQLRLALGARRFPPRLLRLARARRDAQGRTLSSRASGLLYAFRLGPGGALIRSVGPLPNRLAAVRALFGAALAPGPASCSGRFRARPEPRRPAFAQLPRTSPSRSRGGLRPARQAPRARPARSESPPEILHAAPCDRGDRQHLGHDGRPAAGDKTSRLRPRLRVPRPLRSPRRPRR